MEIEEGGGPAEGDGGGGGGAPMNGAKMDPDCLLSMKSITVKDLLRVFEPNGTLDDVDTVNRLLGHFASHCRKRGPQAWNVETLELSVFQTRTWRGGWDVERNAEPLADDAVKHVTELLEQGYLNDIRKLTVSLSLYKVSPTSMESFAKSLSRLKHLQILYIQFASGSKSFLDERQIKVLETRAQAFCENLATALTSSSSLEELEIQNSGYDVSRILASVSGQALAALSRLESLRVLRLRQIGSIDTMFTSLVETLQSDADRVGKTDSLDLSGNIIESEKEKSPMKASGCGHFQSLRELDLSRNDCKPDVMKALLALLQSGQLHHLEYLRLRDNELGAEGALYLAEAFASGHLRRLRTLDISYNNLGDGFEALAKSFQSDRAWELEVLSFEFNGIGDRGISYLAAAVAHGKLPHLRMLYLEINEFGAEGVATLFQAFKSGNSNVLETIGINTGKYSPFSESHAALEEIAGVLGDNKLPSLKYLAVDELTYPSFTRNALENAFRRNLNLIADVRGGGQQIGSGLRNSNEKRLNTLKALGDEEDVTGQHGKVFLCGDPRVGKTTLRITFCRESPPEEQERTRGIEVTNFSNNGVKLALWDLAGQHEYEILHSAFLPDLNFAGGQATFFVILCDSRSIDKARPQLEYWMRFISSNSVKNISMENRRRVFVVLNCFDGHKISEEEQERWEALLQRCGSEKGFKAYLNLHEKPFVVNVKDKSAIRTFKRTIFKEAKHVLQMRPMPKICQSIQDQVRQWVKRRENQNYPVLRWEEFETTFAGYNVVNPDKLRAAVEYLHEAGHIILFKKEDGEVCTFEGGHVIVNPEWFCKRVVGNLLLPPNMSTRVWDTLELEQERDGAVPILTLAKEEFSVPSHKIDEVVTILCRLGICYKLEDRPDIMFVPALMKKSEVQGWSASWKSVVGAGVWVMGFSLKVKDPVATILPKNVLALLQVNVALDTCIGRKVDSDFLAQRNSVSFKFKKMYVLIEYSAHKQERIDILVKPFVRGTSKKEQINVAQEFVSRIRMIVSNCAHGVELDKRIINPWSVTKGWVELHKRKVQIRVESLVDVIEKRGELSMLLLDVEGMAVKEDDVLSDEDLSNFSKRQELLEGGARTGRDENSGGEGGFLSVREASGIDLHAEIVLLVEQMGCKIGAEILEVGNKISEEGANSRHCVMEVGTRISKQFGESSQRVQDVGNRISTEIGATSSHLEEVGDKIRAELGESNQFVNEVGNRISAEIGESRLCTRNAENKVNVELGKLGDLLSLEIRNVDTFFIEDRESSVPRFVYMTEAGEGARRWYLDLTRAVAKPMVLRFLCEADFDTGSLHEVTTQHGIAVKEMKDWAKKLLPLVARTLKVGSVLANVAGKILLPGLDLLIGSDSELSRLSDNLAKITKGGADYTQYTSEAMESSVTGQWSVPSTSGASTSRWNPGMETQIGGDVVRALSRVRKRKEDDATWSLEVGLRRVRLRLAGEDQCGEKHVKWICSSCHECYKRERPGSIQDCPVVD